MRYVFGYVFLFFFSSRRRHTRLVSDWSSDVCSSDLIFLSLVDVSVWVRHLVDANPVGHRGRAGNSRVLLVFREKRSEERRVGKECRSRWWQEECEKKETEIAQTHDKQRSAKSRHVQA